MTKGRVYLSDEILGYPKQEDGLEIIQFNSFSFAVEKSPNLSKAMHFCLLFRIQTRIGFSNF